MTTDNVKHVDYAEGDEPPLEELARRKGVRAVESVHDMARPGLFESDEELAEFLAHVYSQVPTLSLLAPAQPRLG